MSHTAAGVIRALAVESGDFDRNGLINAADLIKWKDSFGPTNGADADSDGADFLTWQRQLGATRSESLVSAVPEPTAFSLVCLFLPSLLVGRLHAVAVPFVTRR